MMRDSLGNEMNNERLETLFDEIKAVVAKYPDIRLFIYAENDKGRFVSGNHCVACNAIIVAKLLLMGEIPHAAADESNTNDINSLRKAALNN